MTKTLTASTIHGSKTNLALGNCHGDANPDAWFPTTYNGGRPNVMFRNLLPDIKYALEKCNSCPVRKKCLEEGMRPVNLSQGIWGGTFAGQRIFMARDRHIDYLTPEGNRGRRLPRRSGDAWPEPYDGITMQEEEDALLFYDRVLYYVGDELSKEGLIHDDR